jgi:F-type H+-transporting ATPase subunit b
MPRREAAKRGNDDMKKSVTALSGLILVPALAVAAEGESNLFAGDLGNAVWTLVIFLLVIFVLGKFAWGPLLSTLQEREKFIRDSLEEAKADREAAEARLAEYEEKLREARAEASEIVKEGRRDAEVLRRRVEDDAKEEAEKIVRRARREIEIAKQTAVKDIYGLTARLATSAAAKIVRQDLTASDHERLIRDSIAELEKMDSN